MHPPLPSLRDILGQGGFATVCPEAKPRASLEVLEAVVLDEGPLTWRIIPVSKWLVTMVSKSPKWGYSPYKWPKWLINGGY